MSDEQQQAQPAIPQPQQSQPVPPGVQAAPGAPVPPQQGFPPVVQGQPGVPPQQQALPPQQHQAAPPQHQGFPPVAQGQPGAPMPPQHGFPPVAQGQPGPATPMVRQEPYNPGAFAPVGGQPPVQHGRYGPGTFQADAEEPDWTELAQRHEAHSRKKKRVVVAAVSTVSLLVIGGIVAAAIALTGDPKNPQPIAGPSGSGSPSASASASGSSAGPKSPEEALSKSTTDKAKLSSDALFPDQKITVGSTVYTRVATERDTECGNGTSNGLGAVLNAEDCQDVYLATYVSDKTAVTVGYAVFSSKAQADRVKGKVKGNIKALRTNATPNFCVESSKCAPSNASFGRYDIFSIAGNSDLSPLNDGSPAKTEGAELVKHAIATLTARGTAAMKSTG